MKKREMMAWVIAAMAAGMALGWQGGRSGGAQAERVGGEKIFAQTGPLRGVPLNPTPSGAGPTDVALRALGDKLDLIQSSNAGRYVFALSGAKGEFLVRIDRVRGELAFLDDTGSAKWVTLSIFEERIDTTNSKFKGYVESLRNVRPL